MVRTVKNHHRQEEEEDEEDYVSRTTNGSSQQDGRSSDQKGTSHRSKHSETEQRRRSKINERFEILRELIPENDQKRDRASFLLEVIQYIQFLQEKLQLYEGWSPDPTKLMPWRGLENLADQSHNLIEPELSGKITDQNTFEPDVDFLTSQSRPQTWPNDVDESSISNAYSKGLMNSLTHALGSSGVDLSQTSISAQFDIRKGTNSGPTSTSFGIKDNGILSSGDISNQAYKRPRTEQNQ